MQILICQKELGAIAGDTFAFDPNGHLTETQAILSGGIAINGDSFKKVITFDENLEHGEDAQSVGVPHIGETKRVKEIEAALEAMQAGELIE